MANFSNREGILKHYQKSLDQYERSHRNNNNYLLMKRIRRNLIEVVERRIDLAAGLDIVLALAIYRARLAYSRASDFIEVVGQMKCPVEIRQIEFRIRDETAIWVVTYFSATGARTTTETARLLVTLNILWDGLAVKPLTA